MGDNPTIHTETTEIKRKPGRPKGSKTRRKLPAVDNGENMGKTPPGKLITPDSPIPGEAPETGKPSPGETPPVDGASSEMADAVVSFLEIVKCRIDETKPKGGGIELREPCRKLWERFFREKGISIPNASLYLVGLVSVVYVSQAFFSDAWKKRTEERKARAAMEELKRASPDNGSDGNRENVASTLPFRLPPVPR